MRIEFLTDDNPLYVLPFFREFVTHYAAAWEITQISSCAPMGKRSRTRLLQELAHLYGAGGMARLVGRWGAARALGVLPRGPGASRYHTLKQLCRAHAIPYMRIDNPNHPAFVAGVRGRRTELLVSIACPYILKAPLLATPPHGCINVHHAPLPRYKGMMPTFWQMYQGEKTVGVTVHYMNAKVDEGPALFQGTLELQPGESLDQVIQRSKRHAAHCVAQVLSEIASRTQRTITLDPGPPSYFSFPTVDEIREFRRRGLRAL